MNTVRFVGDQNGEICFEVMSNTEFDLTIDILNTNKDKIKKRPFNTISKDNNRT